MASRFFSFLLLCSITALPLPAQETPPATPATDEATPVTIQVTAPAASMAALDEIFVVPEGKTAEELFQYVQETRIKGMKAVLTPQSTDADFDAFMNKFFPFALKVMDKIIVQQPSDALLEEAYGTKLIVTAMIWQDDPAYEKNFMEVLETIRKLNKFPDLVAQGNAVLTSAKIKKLHDAGIDKIKPEEVVALKDEVKALLTADLKPPYASLVLEMCALASEVGAAKNDKEFAPKIEQELFKLFNDSQDEQIQQIAELLPKMVRTNIGKEASLEGLLLDGKKFDWKSYRGKVVLLNFWAVEAPVCVEQYPSLVALYDKFKDKGFDIVLVALDEEPEATAKFVAENKTPWAVLSETQTMKAEQPSIFENYNIEMIPKAFVIDKEGRIAAVDPTPEELEKLLGKLLAP